LGLLSPPYPLFQWYLQNSEILLNLDEQGSSVIIVVVLVGAAKIYVAVVEVIKEKGKTG
jgi:hypothetical protein